MQNEDYSFSIEVEPVVWHNVSDLLSQLGAKATINLKKAGDFPVVIDIKANSLSLPAIIYGLSELSKNIGKQNNHEKDYIKVIIKGTPACFSEHTVEEITAAIQTGKELLPSKKGL